MSAGYLKYFHFKKARTPFADVAPALSEDEAERLRVSIKSRGVDEPIEVDPEGNILDGHHRQKYEPDCPFRVKEGLKSDEAKRMYVYGKRRNRGHMTKTERERADKLRKEDYMALRKQHMTQEQISGLCGIPRQTLSDWENKWQSQKEHNAGAGNTSGPTGGRVSKCDQRRNLSDEEIADICRRRAQGESTKALAAEFGVSQPTINRHVAANRDNGVPPKKVRKSDPMSVRALAVRRDIHAGGKQVPVSLQYGFSSTAAYRRAALVAKSGNQVLIDAMDKELLSTGKAAGLVGKTAKEIEAELERARLAEAKKRHKLPTSKGKPKSQLLAELLEGTWTEWQGFAQAVTINSKTIPKQPDKLADVQRLIKSVRKIVNRVLTETEKECVKCSRKTHGKNCF